MAEHSTVTAVTKARAAMEAEEQALLRLLAQSDLYRPEQARLRDQIKELETERRRALAGDCVRDLAAINADLARTRGEYQEVTSALEELDSLAGEASGRVAKAEKVLQDALDGAWSQRYDAAHKALVEAINRLSPDLRQAALETGTAWPSLSEMLKTVSRDADWFTHPATQPPAALTGSRSSALLTDEVRRHAA